MNVNEQAYGSKDLWYSICFGSTRYPESVAIEERNTLANFTNTVPSETYVTYPLYLGRAIYEIEVNGNQTLRDLFYNRMFDRSICFVGQSGKSSYKSIKLLNNQGTDSSNPNANESMQTYDVVNLAFSFGDGNGHDYGNGVRKWAVIGADVNYDPNPNSNKFTDIRWNPLGNIGYQSSTYYYLNYSYRNNITFVTNIGVKRNVLVPYVMAGTTDTSDTNAIQTYDLATYLSTYKDSKPYVYSIGFEIAVMYGESTEASSSNRRSIDTSYRLMLMEYIGALNDFYYVGANTGGQTEQYNNDLFVPQTLKTPHIPIGGYINNGLYNGETPSTLGYESSNTVYVHAVIDCNDIKWDTWVNVRGSTAEGTCNKILVADARTYTVEEFREAVRHSLACFGMFFADSETVAQQGKLDDPDMHLGTIINGVGYGDYTSGSDNRDQVQWDWDSMSENEYEPDNPPEPPDPNVYDTASQLNTPSRCASGTKYYVLNAAGVENLVGELWKAQESIPSDTSYMDFNNEQYLSNNPIDMIVSCKRYPLIPLKASESEPLVLGQYQTNVQGYVLSDTTTWINLGSKLIYKHFKNYLDYQTKIVLYIPFCGMINLDPSVWIGQTVNVYMAVDYITGSCTAYLIRDSDKVIYATAEGNCSVDLPVTGLQAATIESQLLRSKSSLDSSKLMIGAKILGGVTAFAIAATTGGAGAAAAPAVIGGVTTIASTISDAYKINQLNYDLHHTEAPVQQIGSSSPLNAWSGELECRLYVYYPVVDPDVDDTTYAHSIGNATVQQGTIGSFGSSGDYAVFTNADLSDINCTDSEKTMINNALISGVYL